MATSVQIRHETTLRETLLVSEIWACLPPNGRYSGILLPVLKMVSSAREAYQSRDLDIPRRVLVSSWVLHEAKLLYVRNLPLAKWSVSASKEKTANCPVSADYIHNVFYCLGSF